MNLRFHFDFISPYAYLAWTQLGALVARHASTDAACALAIEPVPILFAALLDANRTKGPAEIPSKRAYMWKDTMRSARALGVPFVPPPAHPFNPLLALRVASLAMDHEERVALVDAIFRACWERGLAISDPRVVEHAANEAKLDGAALVRAAATPDAKARVKDATDAALAAGIFGVPTMVIDGEMFWGLDSLPHLERHLADPRARIDAAVYARFTSLEPSAKRI